MSRYIKLADVINHCEVWRERAKEKKDRNGWWIADNLLRLMQDTPNVDIVFCKECKHRYDDGWLEPRWTCDYLKDMRLKDDDFCSYGEREGE